MNRKQDICKPLMFITLLLIHTLTLAASPTLARSMDVKMLDVMYYRDGGTTGFEAEVDGKRRLFCLDGRARIGIDPGSDIKPVYHVFLNATHPEHPNAIKIPIGGKEEAGILAIISTWIDAELSPSAQHKLLESNVPLTRHQTKLFWAMKVLERLKKRQ